MTLSRFITVKTPDHMASKNGLFYRPGKYNYCHQVQIPAERRSHSDMSGVSIPE